MEEAGITPIIAVNPTVFDVYRVGNARCLTYFGYIAFLIPS